MMSFIFDVSSEWLSLLFDSKNKNLWLTFNKEKILLKISQAFAC